ncbi:MAG: methyltransferase domain-containing protein [Bacteroidetes bacterium]|nr:MAG: methyltransferase domain-containing protein [Bacteroidota bacterium]
MNNHVNDPSYWTEKYLNNATGWDIGEISTPLKEYVDQLVNKEISILIPGCGYGHEAVYLIDQGFKNIHVLDFSPEPLAALVKKVGDEHVSIHCEDIFHHIGSYDLILEQTLFCAIDPSNRDPYIRKIHELLNPQGKFVGVLFNRDFVSGPPFGGSKEEYELLLTRYFSHVKIEACYNSIEPRRDAEVFFIAQR